MFLPVEAVELASVRSLRTYSNMFSSRSKLQRGRYIGHEVIKPVHSIDMLIQHATCLRPVLQRKILQLLSETPHASRIGGIMETPLKSCERAVEKVLRCYSGDCSLLLDVCREVLVFETVEDLCTMLEHIHRDQEVRIVRVKNRLDPDYDSALSAGYRDVMINLQIDNAETRALNVQHHIAEVQLVPSAVYARRINDDDAADDAQNGHTNYVHWRNLRGR